VTDLHAMSQSQELFRSLVLIDSDSGPVQFGQVCEPWQDHDFAQLDPAWMSVAGLPVAEPVKRRAWLERPRGHSKTSDLAIQVAWVLAFSNRQLSGVVAAGDSDQADLLRAAVDRLVRLNPETIGALLTVRADRIINAHTGSVCRIITSDAPSSYGLLCDFIVCDEVTHWQKRDLFDSLLSAAAKRSHCLLVSIANAGFRDSWQWSIRESVRTDSGWVFSRLEGPAASWITPDRLAEQARLLPPAAYRRLWENQWADGAGDAIDRDDLVAAVCVKTPHFFAMPGYSYVLGIDIGLSRDSTAVTVLGKHVGYSESVELSKPETPMPRSLAAAIEAGLIEAPDEPDREQEIITPATYRLRLARVQLWKPQPGSRVSIEAVEAVVLKLCEIFRPLAVAVDPWQAAQLIERLQRTGVPARPTAFTPANLQAMASELLAAFRDRSVVLFPHEQLEADLRALRVEERAYGFRLVSPRGAGGHGDCATALALAMLAAKDVSCAPSAPTIDREIISWP